MRTRWALLAVLVCTTQVAWGQQAATVDPYEVLYGQRLDLPRRPIPEAGLVLPQQTLTLVEERTDLLLNRLGRMTTTLASKASALPMRELAEFLRQEHAKLVAQRKDGRPLASLWSSSTLFIMTAFFGSVHEAILLDGTPDAAPGPSAPSRLPELRTRLDNFRDQVQLIKPQNAATVLAIAEAQVAWVDLSGLLDLVQNRPSEFYQLLAPTLELPPTARDRVMRLVVEPIAVPLVDWWLEEAELLLQASLLEKTTQPLRLEEAGLRELAHRYQDVANVNLKLLTSRTAGRSLPKRATLDEFVGRLSALLILQRLDYVQQHREDSGVAAAFTLLATSFAAYRSILNAHELLEIATAPVIWGDDTRNTSERTQATTRQELVGTEFLRARQAASLVRSALGTVPTPIRLATQLGRELSEQPGDLQEWALEEFIDAQAMAQLAIALVTPSAGSASRGRQGLLPGPSAKEQEEAVLRCVEGLRDPSSGVFGRALGYAYQRGWRVQGGELRQLIDDAIMTTCAKARFLNSEISWYFWRVYKNEYATWLREVEINERPAPRFGQTCEASVPSTADDQEVRETCTQGRRAMEQLSLAERTLLGWYIDDGLSLLEISGRLGISYDAARMRVNRASNHLREAYLELERISLHKPRLPEIWFTRFDRLWAALREPTTSDLRRQSAQMAFF